MRKRRLLIILTRHGKYSLFLLAAALLLYLSLNTVAPAFLSMVPALNCKVIIDPGHGGIDGGTGEGSGVLEKDLNLAVSLKLQEELKNGGIDAALTRDKDVSLDKLNNMSSSRHERDLISRVTEFNSGKYDLFVSIHANHCNYGGSGPLVLYSPENFESRLLAEKLQNRLNKVMERQIGSSFPRKPRSERYYILDNSNIPGVIIETGFISNAAEKERLCTGEYQKELSKAITEGIKDYISNMEVEYVEEPELLNPSWLDF